MPSAQAMGYSPFEKSLLNSFTKNGEIMSYEHLKSSAHRLSVSIIYFLMLGLDLTSQTI